MVELAGVGLGWLGDGLVEAAGGGGLAVGVEHDGDVADVLQVVLGHLVRHDVVESSRLDLQEGLIEDGVQCGGGSVGGDGVADWKAFHKC